MESFNELKDKQVKGIIQELEEHYGVSLHWNFLFFINTKRKVHMVGKSFHLLDRKKLRINKMGLYLATQEVDGLRLSVEGAQLVKPTKNFVSLNQGQLKDWLMGNAILVSEKDVSGYVVVKYHDDIVGCGKFKDGTVLNAVGRDRRIKLNTGEEKVSGE